MSNPLHSSTINTTLNATSLTSSSSNHSTPVASIYLYLSSPSNVFRSSHLFEPARQPNSTPFIPPFHQTPSIFLTFLISPTNPTLPTSTTAQIPLSYPSILTPPFPPILPSCPISRNPTNSTNSCKLPKPLSLLPFTNPTNSTNPCNSTNPLKHPIPSETVNFLTPINHSKLSKSLDFL
ncbi:hypothetical protein RRG08_041497 [Elysia crispata]|uniref:Uncharacterized protein n=1 Tax=Elysia crispata TaxID=231223 RepID=A0AAE1CRE6_9GAST|nr:hypothetical protein RRG08_041497 [Elysia crispata]